GRDRNAMTSITATSQLLPTGEARLRHCTAVARRLRSHLLHLRSGQNRPIDRRRDDDPGAAIVDPTPTTPASASPTQTAAPSNPHRGQSLTRPPAGSFPGGFRTPALSTGG